FRRGGSYPPPEVRHGFDKPLVEIARVAGMEYGSLASVARSRNVVNIPAAAAECQFRLAP
ncbi:MAG: hypothetical protein QOE14_126, partial [Humisphaera sp.]|nr:hypothetical protein [Humisphaera sp.]